ncbi:unnamed protein product, partial [Pleuronectes platessa]
YSSGSSSGDVSGSGAPPSSSSSSSSSCTEELLLPVTLTEDRQTPHGHSGPGVTEHTERKEILDSGWRHETVNRSEEWRCKPSGGFSNVKLGMTARAKLRV